MASQTNVPVSQDGRIYDGLPAGIEPWYANGKCTGTGSGQIGITIEFNPTSSRQFQKYVSINHVGITSTTQDLTDDVECLLRGENWEKSPVFSTFFAKLSPTRTIGSGYMGDAWNDCFYAGRSTQGTAGTIEIRTTDVLNAVARFSVSGFVSDRPFIARNDWRV